MRPLLTMLALPAVLALSKVRLPSAVTAVRKVASPELPPRPVPVRVIAAPDRSKEKLGAPAPNRIAATLPPPVMAVCADAPNVAMPDGTVAGDQFVAVFQ